MNSFIFDNLSQTENVYVVKTVENVVIYDKRTHPVSFFVDNQEIEYKSQEEAFYHFQLFIKDKKIINPFYVNSAMKNFFNIAHPISQEVGEIKFFEDCPVYTKGPSVIFNDDHLLTLLLRMREVFDFLNTFPQYKKKILSKNNLKIDHINFILKNIGHSLLSFFTLRKTLKANVHTFYPNIPTFIPFQQFNYLADTYDWIISEFDFIENLNSYLIKPKYLIVQMINTPPQKHETYRLKSYFDEEGIYNEFLESGKLVSFSKNGLFFYESVPRLETATICLYTQGSLGSCNIPEKSSHIKIINPSNPYTFYVPSYEKTVYLHNFTHTNVFPLYIQFIPEGQRIIIYTMGGIYFAYDTAGNKIEIDEKYFDQNWNFYLNNSLYIECILTSMNLEILLFFHLDEIIEKTAHNKFLPSSEKNYSNMRSQIPGHIVINNISELVKFKNLNLRVYRPNTKYLFDNMQIEILSPISEVKGEIFTSDGILKVKILMNNKENIIPLKSIVGIPINIMELKSLTLYTNTYQTLGDIIQPVCLD